MSAPVRVEGSAGKLIPVPEIVLSEEAVVVGLIRSTSGVSIPGAVVRSFRSRRGGVTSDESGRYELRGLGVLGASDTVYVEAVGYAGAEASLSLVPGECRLDFELRPETVLRGQLVGAGGAPVKDVRVVAGFSVDAFDRREARSGSDGTFEIRGLSDGRQRLSTISKEWAPTVTEVEIPSGAVALDVGQLQLSYGRSIRGAVVDDAGDVVNDAVIEMFCGNDVLLDPVKTSADGTFELTGVPDCPVTLLASRPGYVRQICKLGAGAVASVSLVLTRAGTACGAVVDAATGLPATSFRLKLVDASSSEVVLASRDWFRFGKRFENVDGEWTLDGVEIEPGTYVGIEVETDDGRVGFLSSVELAPASLCRPNLIDVAAPLVVHGMVVDAADGARVKGAAIIVHSQVGVEDQSVLARCVTGVDGKFMVKIPHRGMFRLQVTAAHYESSGIEIDPERVRQLQEIVEIRLQKFGRVSGAVLNADGSPVVRCRVLLFKNGKHDGRRQVATDEYGRFVFESVAAGTWVVEANCDEGGTGSQVIRGGLRVEPAEDNWRELRYPGTAILKGEIVPIGECNVPIQIELSRIVSETEGMEGAVQLGTVVRAARDRSFEVRGLGEGAWIVRAIGIDPLLGSWGGNAEVELINGEECNTTIRLVLLRWHGKGR
ncbi:MAG: carboxypeptidase regulatory-like domain-containing protein [Planctomycetes bacterium]|nr:carboxypeptidase regulatory-like domain-containing protein [Planctomycetota bacterium]